MSKRVDLGKIIPEKGVDYYTAAEKDAMENEVTARLVGLYKKYTSIYTTLVPNETEIPINITAYDENAILDVFIEGRVLNNSEYTIADDYTKITLTTALSESGTVVQFVVYKFAQIDSEDYNNLKGAKGDSGAIVFNNVAQMKLDETLEAGDACQTLGYYQPNDDGAGMYRIVDDDSLVDDGGKVHSLANGLKAVLIVDKGILNVKQLGATTNTDIASILSRAINTYNAKYIYCNVDVKIGQNIQIAQNKNVVIDFMNNTVTFENQSQDNIMFNNYGSLKLINATFDGNSNNSINILRARNNSINIVDNCSFINFKETNKDLVTKILLTYTGSFNIITRCHFENIKQVGNGTITDGEGSASCILSVTDTNNITTNPTVCIVDNCTFKNNWNIDTNGAFIVEDFDNIKFQNSDSESPNNMFIVSNITSYNSGKRVVKAQTSNVNINNISCICDNFEMLCVISCFYNNYNISNVFAKCINNSKMSKGIECNESSNCAFDNINIEGYVDSENLYSAGIIITGGSNYSINNVITKGFSSNFTIWGSTKNVSMSNCQMSSIYVGGIILTRTTSAYNPTSGVDINNIIANNCVFETSGHTTGKIWDFRKTNSNTLGTIKMTNCLFKTLQTNYKYGSLACNADLFILDNCTFDYVNNNSQNFQLLNLSGSVAKIINCNIPTVGEIAPYIDVNNVKAYIDKLISNGKIRIFNDGKALLQYCTYNSIEGNTEQNCKIDSFNMS